MALMWRFLKIFVPAASLLLVAVFQYGRAEIDATLTGLQSVERLGVGLGAGALSGKLDMISRDLAYVATLKSLAAAVERTNDEGLVHVADDFIAFARTHENYDQFRWIDETGMERVRVDNHPGGPELIQKSDLQNKGQRYFFKDSIRLEAGEVFISPLDLNIEQDRIETPYKPMLRIATPVVDASARKRGIVILNYHGNELLSAFASVTQGIADHVMMVNGDGYPLHSPRPDEAWGFMFKRPELSLATRMPAVWSKIRNTDDGQLLRSDGMWTWTTVYPLRRGQRSSTGAADAFAASRDEIEAREYVWKSIAHMPISRLEALQQAIWTKFLWIGGFLLLVTGWGCHRLVRAWDRQAAAERRLRSANAGLESTVAERTSELQQKILELSTLNNRLADNDESLRCILASTQDGYWRVDASGCLRAVNPAYCAMSGYDQDTLLGMTVDQLEFNEDPTAVASHIAKVAAEGRDLFETRHRRKDGSVWDAEVSTVHTRVEGGQFYAFIRDISERKRLHVAQQALSSALKEAQRIARVGNWMLDHEHGALTWSNEVFHIFERDPDQHVPSFGGFLQAVHPDDRATVQAAFSKSLDEQRPYELVHRLLFDDGRIKWVLEKGESTFSPDGHPLETRGIVQDITEDQLAAAALRTSEQRFRDLVNTTDGIVWEADARTFDFTFVSEKAERLLGYPAAAWREPGFWMNHLHSDDKAWASEYIVACARRLESLDFEYRFMAADGRCLWLRNMVSVVAEGGEPRWLRGVMVDVSQRKQTEAQLLAAHQLIKEVQRLSKLGGWRYDSATGKVTWTEEVFVIHGLDQRYDPADAEQNIGFYEGEDRQRIADAFRAAVSRGIPYDLELRLLRRDGRHIWVRTMGNPQFEGDRVVAVTGNILDITERKAVEEEIRALAFHDPLTRLANRRMFFDRVRIAIAAASRHGRPGALFFIDLDRFKQINDTFGHDAGDLLLQAVGTRLLGVVRTEDTVARLGGDEFVVMVEHLAEDRATAAGQATAVGNKILEALSAPYRLGEHEGECTPSIGIVIFTGDEPSEAALIKRADRAMYQAKFAGRNRLCLEGFDG